MWKKNRKKKTEKRKYDTASTKFQIKRLAEIISRILRDEKETDI